MNGHDFQELVQELRQAIIEGASAVGILGFTEVTLELLAVLESYGIASKVHGVYASPSITVHELVGKVPILAFDALRDARLDVIVVADDANDAYLREVTGGRGKEIGGPAEYIVRFFILTLVNHKTRHDISEVTVVVQVFPE